METRAFTCACASSWKAQYPQTPAPPKPPRNGLKPGFLLPQEWRQAVLYCLQVMFRRFRGNGAGLPLPAVYAASAGWFRPSP